ncbi:MAG TPA: YqgE/AlgH family protein [Arenimonas sp.]|tara:strand:- start:1423 stop:1986 length:564 start_codon:yes stop_codon:yes gene_type:complete
MSAHRSLAEHFLIAMPALDDPNFFRSVTLVCQHDQDGAMGLVVNLPSDFSLGEMLAQMKLPTTDLVLASQDVLAGGPVQPDRGFVLHDDARDWPSTLRLANGLAVTTSREILESMARGDGPARQLVALGYAGWEAGQLEDELAANSWLTVPAEKSVLFDTPMAGRWHAAARCLGVDIEHLADYAGHA